MGFFDLFGKKKEGTQDVVLPDMPVPDQAPGGDALVPSDIAPIHAGEHSEMDLPPPPRFSETHELEAPNTGFVGTETSAPEQAPAMVSDQSSDQARETGLVESAHIPLTSTFISVSDYKFIFAGINTVKARLAEADGIVERLASIRTQEEQFFERWRNQLEEIERKINSVDRVIGKG